ncbi:hypothetical protein TNIN_292181 [Trichonephila inaurata madagascariensis]|uniref:Uncharacterized protein n=1 Tax=Trichonephila inaurata madagascariensis TaxID=2747483 RepID=A0A8X6MER3_9ARAC|nr:hypothetical protein TNIN_292181 [Trichonephila inaurata madagascariensis]
MFKLSVLLINFSLNDLEINIVQNISQICLSEIKTFIPNYVSGRKDELLEKNGQETVIESLVRRVAVKSQHPSDLGKLVESFKCLAKSDPKVQCVIKEPESSVKDQSNAARLSVVPAVSLSCKKECALL